MIWAICAGALLGGFGRRVAGGLFEPLKGKSLIARGFVTHLIYAASLGLAIGLGLLIAGRLLSLWWLAVATGVGTFVGHSLGLHHSLSMGRYPSRPGGPNDLFSWRLFALHWLGMTAYGWAVLAVPIVVCAWVLGWMFLASSDLGLVGAACATPLIYAMVYAVQDRAGLLRGNPAEWITGACYGAACSVMMPLG